MIGAIEELIERLSANSHEVDGVTVPKPISLIMAERAEAATLLIEIVRGMQEDREPIPAARTGEQNIIRQV